MGIELSDLIEIMTWINEIPVQNRDRLLFIGDTKFYCDNTDLHQIAHGLGMDISDSINPISAKNFGHIFGFRRTDTLGLEGECSIIFDIMSDPPDELLSQFDLIIDAGVLFWTFNPGTAIANLSRMASETGQIVHITALTGHFGAAYFNIHPKFFIDFYKLNEFELLTGGVRKRRISLFSQVSRKLCTSTKSTHMRSEYLRINNTSPSNLGMVLTSPLSRILIKLGLKSLTLHDREVGIFGFKRIRMISGVKFPLLLELELQK
jgi:hypothetical protein